MGYFDDCRPDQRFTAGISYFRSGGTCLLVTDWDQRRTIAVVTTWVEEDNDVIFEALAKHIDNIPADAFSIKVSRDGELLSCSLNADEDPTVIPFYPSVADYPQGLRKIRRSDLTEIDRLGVQADLTTYESLPGQIRRVVFKYYTNRSNIAAFWHELHCVLSIPKHPNIVPFDSLVFDTVDGEGKVVGFTAPFIPGGTVLDNISRVFKLKYLKQLIETVDYLNLRVGVVHGDICCWNLLINPETDNLQVFDFNMAAKLGWEGDPRHTSAFRYEPDRNDVKLVTFTLYEIITRDLHFRYEYYPEEQDPSDVLEMEAWEKHSEVRLDHDVSDYRHVLEDWVLTREKVDKEITHYTQAPDFIDWPSLPEFPLVHFVGDMWRNGYQLRGEMIRRGENFLKWQRPASRQLPLPQGKRLLATGEIIDDSAEVSERESKEATGLPRIS